MFTNHPIAPKQPRRVRSGDRTPIRDDRVAGAHRVTSGQRRPIGHQPDPEPEDRPGTRRRVPPAYARRRSQ